MEHSIIAQHRLVNQLISGGQCANPAAVVRHLGALQAQDYAQAVWAVGLRTPAATRASVEQAIINRHILLTWPMRGTIHFVPAEDAQWMLELLTPKILAAARQRRQQLELDEAIIDRVRSLFYEALRGGRCLPRLALMQLLDAAGISPQGQRGYHLLWCLAQEGLICFGPQAAGQQTFVLLAEWVPQPRRLARDEGLAELARRYFHSHGPATIPDFANWAGLTLTAARQGHEAIRAGLVAEQLGSVTFWRPDVKPGAPAAGQLHLLPGFDEYFLGYKDRSALITPAHSPKICPGNNGIFKPMVVVNGQIVGTWSRKLVKNAVDISVDFFAPTPAAPAAIATAAERYAAFLEVPLGRLTLA